MKWITTTDLKQWADTRDCQDILPELIKKLITASITSIEKLKFPSGDAVCLSGLDGILISEQVVYHNISGISFWECGSTQDVNKKAESDYIKRKQQEHNYDVSETTFVFVTPRIWEKSETWANNKKSENYWKDVVAITAVELEDWIEKCPSVGLWLAEHLHKTPLNDVCTLETYWKRWSVNKDNLILQPDILLGGRDNEIKTMLEKIKVPNASIVQSMSQEESLAFIVASILESDDKSYYSSKCIIVNNENSLNKIIEQYTNLIIITTVENKRYNYAVSRGHSILYAVGNEEVFSDSIKLSQIKRDKFVESLQKSGYSYEQANQLSRETARNITILRRKLEFDYNAPIWSKAEYIREIMPAIFVGKWNENNDGDKEIISTFAGEPYEDYQQKLQKWLNISDSPFICVNGNWRIASQYETFSFSVKYMTSKDFELFKSVFAKINNDIESDALEKREATSYYFSKFQQKYTMALKEGVLQSAILISLFSENNIFANLNGRSRWIDDLIILTLNGSTLEWWLSYKHIISAFAEASPKKFIEFITNDLKKDKSIIKELFTVEQAQDYLFSSDDYTDVLFALEKLAWDKELLLSVSFILIELSQLKNESNMANKPINSLESIYKVWMPQTFAEVNERNQALKTLVRKFPKQGFDLCYRLVNRLDYGTAFPTSKMRWRLFGNIQNRDIIPSDVYSAIDNAIQLLIDSCNKSSEQVCNLIDISSQSSISNPNRDKIIAFIEANINLFIDDETITDQLRQEIYHHKSYPDANWALPSYEISKYEKLMQSIEPTDVKRKYLWLFKDYHLESLEIDKDDYKRQFQQTIEIRSNALKEIFQIGGINAVFEFANTVNCPSEVGTAYAHICCNDDFEQIFIASKQGTIPLDFAKSFFSVFAQEKGIDVFISQLKKFEVNHSDYIYLPLSALSISKEILSYIETLPLSIQNSFWNCVQINWFYDNNLYIIKKLNYVNRAIDSLEIIYHNLNKKPIQSDIILSTIQLYISNLDVKQKNISYKLEKIILYLDKDKNVKTEDIIQIELLLYKLLENSNKHLELRLMKELLSNPHTMMELISLVYLPSNELEKEKQQNEWENNANLQALAKIGFSILWKFDGIPFVDKEYNIAETELNNYIDQLIELGKQQYREDAVYVIIGKMLGNYPEIGTYPPEPICKIIERLDNEIVNNNFYCSVFNKRGVTFRPAVSGIFKKKEAEKYKKYANATRFSYPIISKIFDGLSREYNKLAVDTDNRTIIEELEY